MLKAQGDSMFPLLRSGDILFFKKISFARLRVNDIGLIAKKKITFTHRIIFRTTNYLITKGDNSNQSDGKIFPKQFIAKLDKIRRKKHYFKVEDIYLLQATLYFQEILKIKKIFERNKLDYLFLKGLPLHLYFENQHPKRLFLDCDILIKRKKYLKVKRILKKEGFKEAEQNFSFGLIKLKNKKTETQFYKIINGLPIILDIHLEVVFMLTKLPHQECFFSKSVVSKITNEFLKKKKLIKINGESFPILEFSDFIIYLSLHFFHHNYRGSFRLAFLDKIIKNHFKKEGDYENITSQTMQYGLNNFIYPVFLFLKKYYKTPIPDNFLKQIKPKQKYLSYIRKNILKINIFNDETRTEAGINRFRYIFFLSQNAVIYKSLVFFNPQVLYLVGWAIFRKIFKLR